MVGPRQDGRAGLARGVQKLGLDALGLERAAREIVEPFGALLAIVCDKRDAAKVYRRMRARVTPITCWGVTFVTEGLMGGPATRRRRRV